MMIPETREVVEAHIRYWQAKLAQAKILAENAQEEIDLWAKRLDEIVDRS